MANTNNLPLMIHLRRRILQQRKRRRTGKTNRELRGRQKAFATAGPPRLSKSRLHTRSGVSVCNIEEPVTCPRQYLIEHPEFDPPIDSKQTKCGAGAPARESDEQSPR